MAIIKNWFSKEKYNIEQALPESNRKKHSNFSVIKLKSIGVMTCVYSLEIVAT